jgi:CRISPR-associated protein Cmr6
MQRRSRLEAQRFDAEAHPSLWFDRFAPSTGGVKLSDVQREEFLKDQMMRLRPPPGYEALFQTWQAGVEAAGAEGRKYETVRGTSVAANLGGASLLENGIPLHPLYGVPYLSGRSLKGLASRFARNQLGERWKRDTDSFITLFGDQSAAGYVTFLDSLALPQTGSYFRREVMTPHHPEYYGTGRDAPTDRDSPIPIHFLTVRARFLVCILGPDPWRKAAFEVLTMALKEEGIGGKTKLGAYGRLAPVRQPAAAAAPPEWRNATVTFNPAGNWVRCTQGEIEASSRLRDIAFEDEQLRRDLRAEGRLAGVTVRVAPEGRQLRIISITRAAP